MFVSARAKTKLSPLLNIDTRKITETKHWRTVYNGHTHHETVHVQILKNKQRWLPIQNRRRSEQDKDSATRWSCTSPARTPNTRFYRGWGCYKRLLAPRGSPPLDNCELISSLLDKVEATPSTSRSENLLTVHAWAQVSPKQFQLFLRSRTQVFSPVQLCPEKNTQHRRQDIPSALKKYYHNSVLSSLFIKL